MTTHIDVRLPRGVATGLAEAAKRHGITRGEFIRRLVVAALDHPERPPPRAVPRQRPLPEICATPERDVFDLFERGHSIMQIAAITHLPYGHIAAMIGRQVDARHG